jgi:hypothetical protein
MVFVGSDDGGLSVARLSFPPADMGALLISAPQPSLPSPSAPTALRESTPRQQVPLRCFHVLCIVLGRSMLDELAHVC